jgi:hypothetical protein
LGDLLFFHSFLIVPKTPVSLLGQDLLSQLKAQILLPPGSYLCCPLLQEQIDPTVWTDEMSVGQAWMALPSQIKLKDSLTVSTPKTTSPQARGMMRPYAYHKFLKTRATN